MNFQGLQRVELPQAYIDRAFSYAQIMAEKARRGYKGTYKTRLDRSKDAELAKVRAVGKSVMESMDSIVKGFPSLNTLPPFYLELVKVTLEYGEVKQSLGAMVWVKTQTAGRMQETVQKLKHAKSLESINKLRNAFYGRVASLLKQVKKHLVMLEHARKTMKEFPGVKTSVPVIVIAGFPNVGKTTLLSALTGSTPEIAPYPFTTQQIMIGTMREEKIQVMDTPGLLDRPLHERNRIELQAVLALKHLAQGILFIIDPTLASGYTLDEQVSLLREVKKSFPQAPFVIILNKVDGASQEELALAQKRIKEDNIIEISAVNKQGIDVLRRKIVAVVAAQEAKQEKAKAASSVQ